MAKKIEIYENTLLKLLVRRGIDIDRKNVVLSEGELGYTTDTKKLYIGDGQTPGGILVQGNSILESTNDILTLSSAIEGDIVFRPSDGKLYRFKGGDYSLINNWEVIGVSYTTGNGTIVIANNEIRVGEISAGNIHSSALGSSLKLDDNGKIAIDSSSFSTDTISVSTPNGFLTLPAKLKINNVDYIWPSGGSGNTYLKRDAAGNLNWVPLESETTVVSTTTANQVPVGSIVPFISSTNIPSSWLLCNGQSVLKTTYSDLFQIIGTTYGGDATTFKVPNLTNTALYGVQNTPATSTLYNIASSASGSLSATGTLFLIKAIADPVAAPTITITSPLTCSVNGADNTGAAFSPLSGNIVIGYDSPPVIQGSSGYRNKAINGNFDFWQRATATVSSPVSAVTRSRTADRWASYATGPNNANFSVTRRACSTTEFEFFNANFFQRLTYNNGVGSSTPPIYGVMDRDDAGVLALQNFENAAEILGKTVTLSFWARASQPTKIFSESQIFTIGSQQMWTPTIHKVFDLTTSWQKFTHTYTMPTFQQVSAVAYNPAAIPTNTETPVYTPLHLSNSLPPLSSWLYQIDIKTHWTKYLSIKSGNAWSGTTSYRPGSAVNYPGEAMTPQELQSICQSVLSSTAGGYYDIAQIQLEEGDVATDFEFKPPGTELALCQRYYYKTYDVNTPPNTVTDENSIWSHEPVAQIGGGVHIAQGSYAVPMARVPSVYFYNPRNSSATAGVSGSVFVSGATGDNGTVGAVDRGTKRVSNFNISYTRTPPPAYDLVIVGYHFTADAEI